MVLHYHLEMISKQISICNFRSKNPRFSSFPRIWMNNVEVARVDQCKYLGVILSGNGDMRSDIDRVINGFLKQFNSMYSKFYFVDRNVLIFLFKSFTSSLYGIDLWYQKMPQYQINQISVAYHKAIKKMMGLNVWDSNHQGCEMAGVSVFKHLLAKRLICFWHRLFRSGSSCMANLSYYWRYRSCIFKRLSELFRKEYSVDISLNPLCAILARIDFVQRHEPRSHYAPD